MAYTLKQFLQMPMPRKKRLQENDRAEYDRLKALADQNFPIKPDPEAQKELSSNPKGKKLKGKDD